ncbi:MAG TPA: hypothetical protein PKA34_22790 [Blastocatellia bacterium]|nr:hypothetical protein [Blastocatellia bacterium]HNG33987.1 hypothetical protein [Blastocatellia bacterium]
MNSAFTKQSSNEQTNEALRRVEAWLEQQREQRTLTFADGQLLAVAERDGLTSKYGYDAAGDLTSIAEDGGETAFEYDAQRRLTKVRHADNQLTAYFYGDSDRLIAVEDRGLHHEFEHDDAGRLTAIRRGTDGSGAPRRLLPDSAARTKDLADRFAAGYRTTLTRDAQQLTLTTLGQPNLELGDNISVSDIPDAMANGSGYVQAIRHRFGADIGFLTDLRLVLGS